MGSGGKVTVGYKYHLGIHMVLAHGPIDKITKIEVDEKTAWEGSATGGTITLDNEELFGGEEREGGVKGDIDILMGDAAQVPNTYLQNFLGAAIPAYRGVVSLVLKSMYIGMNPYLKRWAFWGQRIHTLTNGNVQWYDAKADIDGDLNPAHIIRECITDTNWGMGYLEVDVDDVSFTLAADQLFDEGMGISLLWDRSVPINDFIETILKHIDGSLFIDRDTGLYTLKLARDDYDVNNILSLGDDNINKIGEFKRATLGELINSVTVVYTDRDTGKKNSVTVQDIALVAQQKGTISTTKQYPGFTKGDLASRAASRALKALSSPLATATIYANRTAASLNVGDVFKLSWSQYGLTDAVMRVISAEYGALENNVVKIKCVEDVFAIGNAIYSAPPASEWTDPNNLPAPCPNHSTIEAPYWTVARTQGETLAENLDPDAGFALITGTRPTSDAINAKIHTNPTNTGYTEAGTVDFCPYGETDGDVLSRTQTVIPIRNLSNITGIEIGTYAVWGTEIVSVEAITQVSVTLSRACLDTVPVPHYDGEGIYFAENFYETDGVDYIATETCRLKLLPKTGRGILDIASAPEQTVIMNYRAYRPYPPARLTLEGDQYRDAVRGDIDFAVSFKYRDRLQQTASLIGDDFNANIGPENGTTYTVEIRTEGGTLIASEGPSLFNSRTFTVAELGSNYGRLRFIAWSTRDTFDSYQKIDYTFTRAGYGTAYGYAYGGA